MKPLLDDLTALGLHSPDCAAGEGKASPSRSFCVFPPMGKGQGADNASEVRGGQGVGAQT